jgi:hypothetical protein
MLEPIAIDLDLPFVVFDHMEPMGKNYYRGHFESQNMSLKRRALFIYTSGTTGKVSTVYIFVCSFWKLFSRT